LAHAVSLIPRRSLGLLTREPLWIDADARLRRKAFVAATDAVIRHEIRFDPNPQHLPAPAGRASPRPIRALRARDIVHAESAAKLSDRKVASIRNRG
jgi:hypothetical protein